MDNQDNIEPTQNDKVNSQPQQPENVENVEEATPAPAQDDVQMEDQKISPANEDEVKAQDESNDKPMENQEGDPPQQETENIQDAPAVIYHEAPPAEPSNLVADEP